MLRQEWRFGGRRDVYADYNSLTLAVTVDALFGSAVDRVQAQQVSSAPFHVTALILNVDWVQAQQVFSGFFTSRDSLGLLRSVTVWLLS
jgi:hypothetical protein